MNRSIQTLVAIFVLVGGASVSSLIGVVEAAHTPPPGGASLPPLPDQAAGPSEPFVPFETAKKLCLNFVRSELMTVELPSDIAALMQLLSMENPGVSMEKSFGDGLISHRKPESCPEFVERIKKIKEKHCGLLEKHHDFPGNIDDDLVKDETISPIIFAVHACVQVAELEPEEEYLLARRKEMVERYDRLTVPEDLMDLIRRKDKTNDWIVREEDLRLEESCEEFSRKADPLMDVINELLLYQLPGSFQFGDKFLWIMQASQLCKEIKNHIESRQSVAEGSSQSMELDHD